MTGPPGDEGATGQSRLTAIAGAVARGQVMELTFVTALPLQVLFAVAVSVAVTEQPLPGAI